MLKPSVTDLMKVYNNRYSLVIAIAKRARQIASKAELDGEILEEKPISLAIDELLKGNYRIVS